MSGRKPGRPPGSRNKGPLKQRYVELDDQSFEVRVLPTLESSTGLGTYLQLENILNEKLTAYWTDERILQYFPDDETAENMENACHIYSSSKGKMVIDDGSLSKCSLFPGISISVSFLENYLHNYDDVANYGDFIHATTQRLRHRARLLHKQKKK